ncbi:MAG: VPLPA-CTERM sorting domain-containing protein [Pseudomonadota bacterium]
MIRIDRLAAATAVAIFAAGAAHAASFNVFTDRTAFEAAATSLELETFNGVSGQPSFANTPLTVGDLTLQSTGTLSSDIERNAIDQPPTQFGSFDIDGTAVANVLLTGGDDDFTITFADPITAFFADFGAFNDEIQRTQIVVNGEQILPPVSPDDAGSSFGFISDMAFTSILFTDFDGDNDGFSIDNIAYGDGDLTAVPVPATLPLLLGGLAIFGLMRRRA